MIYRYSAEADVTESGGRISAPCPSGTKRQTIMVISREKEELPTAGEVVTTPKFSHRAFAAVLPSFSFSFFLLQFGFVATINLGRLKTRTRLRGARLALADDGMPRSAARGNLSWRRRRRRRFVCRRLVLFLFCRLLCFVGGT